MSSEEKKQILKMVEEGRISAEEAMKLIKVLEENPDEKVEIFEAAPGGGSGSASEFEAVARRARRLWVIPMWIGMGITVLAAYWLYTLVQASNYGLWFYCAWVPFLVGVLLLALFAGSRTSRWLFVNVDRTRAQDWPQTITLGFPVPIGPVSWFLRNFGSNIQGLQHTQVDEILDVLAHGTSSETPLIVNVDESEGGERVQVYIG